MSRVRIVCTLGPNAVDPTFLRAMAAGGMGMARLNGSHSNIEWHKKMLGLLHEILPEIPILLDIPGRKIRTLGLKIEPVFDAGEEIIFTTNIDHDGSIKVPVNYANLHKDLRVDDLIMADDGTLSFSVLAITDQDIHCKALMRGQIKSRKGINVPFVKLNTPIITARDEEMIEFACANNVDYVGISFVESASHVRKIQSLLDGRGPKVVAKIENQGGLNATEEIIQAADMVMIDRGDLSVETSLYDIAIKQKKIIECSKKYNVPVIVATEMLHSMISQPVPTKAEICDISNAVLDGCSLTMLSGETAIGLFPFEALATMRKVIEASENYLFLKK